MASAKSRQDLSIELMRAIAVFFVIFNHTGRDGYQLFAHYLPVQPAFWAYLAISVFCKFSVPLFFMISGALLLGREPEPLKKLWKKRILPVLVVLVLASAGYYGLETWKAGQTPDPLEFLEKLYRYHSALKYHLWFLYFYIAFLISLPFLQRMAQALEDRWYGYLIGLSAVYGLISMTDYLLGGPEFGMVPGLKPEWLFSSIVLCPCLGYFLQERFRPAKGHVKLLWACDLCAIAASCAMTWYVGATTGEMASELFMETFSWLNAVCVFVTVRYWMQHWKPDVWLSRLIRSAGSCTFGIYLFHPLLLGSPVRNWFIKTMTLHPGGGVNYMLAAFLLCGCTMAVCWAVALLLKKLPVIEKLL